MTDMVQSGYVQYHADLAPLLTDIDSVQQHEQNYNNGDVDQIIESISISGMYRPIYAQRSTNKIIAGNHTWLACKELGAEQIPVVFLDVDDLTATRLMIADNEIARKAKRDDGQLARLLTELSQQDSLMGTGFDDAGLQQLVLLNEVPLDTSDHMSWPSLCFQIHPRTKEAFLAMTDQAGGDRERFELLMRLAGWSG